MVYSAGPARAAGPRLPPVRFEPVRALRREIRTLINHQINIAGWRPRRAYTQLAIRTRSTLLEEHFQLVVKGLCVPVSGAHGAI